MIDWLFTNALAAMALAAIAGVLIWTFRPSPAVRHALWLVVLLKLVSPTGLVISVPLPVEPPAAIESDLVAGATKAVDDPVTVEEVVFTINVIPDEDQTAEEAAALALRAEEKAEEPKAVRDEPMIQAAAPPAPPPGPPFQYQPYLLGLWAIGAIAISWRQLRETLRFARFTRKAHPAGDLLVAEVAIVANRLGVRVPAVRVLTGLTSPVMWCLWRPVLLWPAGLECRLKGEGRRAVLTHELAHLRRRDHWVRRLEMVASVLHWWNPLFWLARKKMRTDAELACDAWAAGQADRRAYAEALLEVCSFNPRRRPAPAVGVIGEGRRAMQERLTMIMKDRVPCRLAFGAKLVVALMVIAAVPAWTLGQSEELAQGKPTGGSDAQVQELEAQIKALAAKLEELKAAKQVEGSRLKATEALKRAQETRVTKQGEAEKARAIYSRAAQLAGQSGKVITAGEGGYKVIGPDGKEVKDVRIIIGGGGTAVVKPSQGGTSKVPMIVEVPADSKRFKLADLKAGTAGQTGTLGWTTKTGSGQSVTLSRATYTLSKDQAAALGTLLGSVKASVMETKVDGEKVTVTTTPEVQSAIGQIVRLITGQAGSTNRFEYRLTPTAPVKPTPPTKPTAPTGIKKPASAALEAVPKITDLSTDVLKNIEIELKGLESLKDLNIHNDTLKELEKLKELRIDKSALEKLKTEIDVIRVDQLKNLENLKATQLDAARKALEKVEVEKVEKLKDLQKRKAAEVDKAGQESQKAKELEAAIKALIESSQKPAKPGSDKPAK